MSNHLYEFTLKVVRDGMGCDLPDEMSGAYVPSYAAAPDHQSAIRKAVAEISAREYRFDDLQGEIREIPVVSWSSYVAKVWPEFADRLPSSQDLPRLVEEGAVFFGPFAGFKA